MKTILEFIGICVLSIVLTWLTNQIPLVQKLWVKFSSATSTLPFFKGSYPEFSLGAIAFFIALLGAVTGFSGEFLMHYFKPLATVLFATGIAVVLLGILLGWFSCMSYLLRVIGLRKDTQLPGNGGQ